MSIDIMDALLYKAVIGRPEGNSGLFSPLRSWLVISGLLDIIGINRSFETLLWDEHS